MNRIEKNAKKINRKLHNIRTNLNTYLTSFSESRFYRISEKKLKIKRLPETKCAVVIHLFYVDNWPLFVNKLANLRNIKFDLFITIPVKNIYFIKEITSIYPRAKIMVVPNRGRDVLPFIRIASRLYESGYEYVLKFHSKKSTHRNDGQAWLESMLDKLLPEKTSIINDIQAKLMKKDTGIVGPVGVYYPLTVNFPANGLHMTNIVKHLYNKKIAYDYLQTKRGDYGFFGGTMFWARLDAIEGLLGFPVCCFEAESGQIDGTFSHALERLFAIVPEIDNRKNYEITEKGIVMRPYRSLNIPNWSTDHLKK